MQEGVYGASSHPDILGVRLRLPSHLTLCSLFDREFDYIETTFYAFNWAVKSTSSISTLNRSDISVADKGANVFMPKGEFERRANESGIIPEDDELLKKFDQELMKSTLQIRKRIKAALR